LRADSPAPHEPRGGKEALEHVKRRAFYWKETVDWMKRMEGELGSDRVLTVRYEDLCKDVRGAITSLLEGCELEMVKCFVERLPPSIASTNEKRFNETVKGERFAIMEVLERPLQIYGYGPYL